MFVLWSYDCLATKVLASKHLATRRVVVSGGGANGLDIGEYEQLCCKSLNWSPIDHSRVLMPVILIIISAAVYKDYFAIIKFMLPTYKVHT